MKKLLIALLFVLFATPNLYAEPAEIRCDNVTNLVGTIASSGTDTEDPVLELVRRTGFEGFFSVQVIKSGSGVLKIEYQVSNDNVTWSPAVEIIDVTVSGTVYPYPASGVNVFSGYIRLVFTETGTASNVVITKVNKCRQ